MKGPKRGRLRGRRERGSEKENKMYRGRKEREVVQLFPLACY